MIIRIPKYKNIIITTVIAFSAIIFFEIIPGFYDVGSKLLSVILQKVSGDNEENLSRELISLREENSRLKKQYFGEISSTEDNNNLSAALEKFKVDNEEFKISINSIKPLKKIKKGRLSYQKISLGMNCNYEDIYNYCRWLEINSPTIEFEEINLKKAKYNDHLGISLVLNVLQMGNEK